MVSGVFRAKSVKKKKNRSGMSALLKESITKEDGAIAKLEKFPIFLLKGRPRTGCESMGEKRGRVGGGTEDVQVMGGVYEGKTYG